MQEYQEMSVLIYRKLKKINKQGRVPLYCRITISDMGNDEFSTGIQIDPNNWNQEFQQVSKVEPQFKAINKSLEQLKKNLEGHFEKLAWTTDFVPPARH